MVRTANLLKYSADSTIWNIFYEQPIASHDIYSSYCKLGIVIFISFLADAFLKRTKTSIGKYLANRISQAVKICHPKALCLHLGYFKHLQVKNAKRSMQKRGIGAWSHRCGPVSASKIFSIEKNYRNKNTERQERLQKILNDKEILNIGLY